MGPIKTQETKGTETSSTDANITDTVWWYSWRKFTCFGSMESWFYDNYCNNADITDNPEEANSDVELNEIND